MERVAVLHVDSAVRAQLRALLEARGLEAEDVASLEALDALAERVALALVLVDVDTYATFGLEAIQLGAAGLRPGVHVPVILIAPPGHACIERAVAEGIDELLHAPIDASELALRIDSGLSRRRTTELVAVASHELRSPVHAISAYLDLLGRSALPTDQREIVTGARTASRHLLDLVEDLLEHARLGQGPVELDVEPFALATVVRDACTIALDAARADHVPVAVSYDVGVPEMLRGDGPRVRQILINLLSNALKFAVRAPVALRIGGSAGALRIEVEDDGPGVPEHVRTIVFEPFRQGDPSVTRRFGGTGLGLAIARSLARRMGGDVRLESGKGQGGGATFVATLRLEAHQAATTAPLALLADGDALHRSLAKPLLERLGYRVEVVTEGVAALMHALESRPALVVVDVELPMLDGTQVAHRLRAAGRTMPIVGFTRYPSDEERDRCVAVGMSTITAKPVTPMLLQRAIRQASAAEARQHDATPASRAVGTDGRERSGERAKLAPGSQMRSTLLHVIDSVERHADALDAAIARRDLATAASVSRALRAALAALNARTLETVLDELERAAAAGDADDCRRAHEAWREAVASLRDDVERFLMRAAGTA